MSYISQTNNNAKIFSSQSYYPYTDKSFNYQVEDMSSNYNGDYFYNAIDLLVSLYKKEVKKHILDFKLGEYKYLVPIPNNIEKFYWAYHFFFPILSVHLLVEKLFLFDFLISDRKMRL